MTQPSRMGEIARQLARLPPEERIQAAAELIESLSASEAQALLHDWSVWGRPEQQIPPGDWIIWFYCAGRGSGKALALDTLIPTPTGWTTMGEIQSGDAVFDESGAPTEVLAAHSVLLDRPCARVRFDDGTSIICDLDHLWLTWNKAARKSYGRTWMPRRHPDVRTTAEIAATLLAQGGRERNHAIPLCAPLKLPELDLPIDPWVLGMWLGDGSSAAAAITIGDQDAAHTLTMLAFRGEPVTGAVGRITGARAATYPIGGRPFQRDARTGRMIANDSLHSRLRALDLLKNKHIPAMYLRASADQRMDLLKGLLDSDGSAGSNNRIEFCSTNRRLAEGVLELARSLATRPTMTESRAKLYGRDISARYRVAWSSRVPMFTLTRKLARQRPDSAQRTRTSQRRIIAVDPVPSVPVRCITVASASELYLCGEGMIPTHNSRAGAEATRKWAKHHGRLILIGRTAADVRDVMIEGEAGLLAISPDDERPLYEPSKRRLEWPNGARAELYSADEPDQLRGPQAEKAWCEEVGAWKHPETLDNLLLGLRLGERPQVAITSTPRPTRLIKALLDPKRTDVHVTRGSTYDNRDNLSPDFFRHIVSRFEGTRLGQQELHGELLTDVEGALWTYDLIENHRIEPDQAPESYRRIIVSVDPSFGTKGDECGIIVGALGFDGHAYILEDLSALLPPAGWGARVGDAYHRHKADSVIAETAFGAETVRLVMKTSAPGVPFREVRVNRGKQLRAEPVVACYEQGKVHHVGHLAGLEQQQTEWVPASSDFSPDRVDAVVHLVTDLLLGEAGPATIGIPSGILPRAVGRRA